MSRTPSSYRVHLILTGGHRETVPFESLEAFQQWYGGVLTASTPDTFVNVPIQDLPGEYLVLRPSSVLAIRVEPCYSQSLDG
jgi:hypothetical protein